MKRVLITGANKGIGLATVSAILERHQDVSVLLGARDTARGREAIDARRSPMDSYRAPGSPEYAG